MKGKETSEEVEKDIPMQEMSRAEKILKPADTELIDLIKSRMELGILNDSPLGKFIQTSVPRWEPSSSGTDKTLANMMGNTASQKGPPVSGGKLSFAAALDSSNKIEKESAMTDNGQSHVQTSIAKKKKNDYSSPEPSSSDESDSDPENSQRLDNAGKNIHVNKGNSEKIPKSIQKMILKQVPKFSLKDGIKDPTHAVNFCKRVKEVAAKLGYNSNHLVFLLEAQLSDDRQTTSWVLDLEQREKKPSTFEGWEARIYKKCRVQELISTAISTLHFYQMGEKDSIAEYYGRYRTTFEQTTKKDDNEAGRHFARSLTPAWLERVSVDSSYQKRLSNERLSIERVYEILTNIQNARKEIDAVRRMRSGTNANQTKPPVRAMIKRVTLSFEERQKLMKEGRCFTCLKHGHRSGDLLCAERRQPTAVAGTKMEKRVGSPREVVSKSKEQEPSKKEESSSEESERYPSPTHALSNPWLLATRTAKGDRVRERNKGVPVGKHNSWSLLAESIDN